MKTIMLTPEQFGIDANEPPTTDKSWYFVGPEDKDIESLTKEECGMILYTMNVVGGKVTNKLNAYKRAEVAEREKNQQRHLLNIFKHKYPYKIQDDKLVKIDWSKIEADLEQSMSSNINEGCYLNHDANGLPYIGYDYGMGQTMTYLAKNEEHLEFINDIMACSPKYTEHYDDED